MEKKVLTYYLIFVLTIFDVVLTAVGLRIGVIEEANPIMNYFMLRSIELTVILVLICIGAVLYFLYRVRDKVRWLSFALGGIVGVKVFVIGMHLNWIMSYFSVTI